MSQQGSPATPYYMPPVPKQQVAPTPSVPKQQVPSTPSSNPTKAQQLSSTLFNGLWQRVYGTLKGQFSVIAIAILLLSLVLAVFLSLSFRHASDDLNTIAYGSIPSVDYAQALVQYIDDIDAKSADFLGTASLNDTPSPCSINIPSSNPQQPISVNEGNKQVYQCDELTINAEMLLANQQLFNAAHNVTYPGEQTAVERITEGLEEYNGHLTVMMHEFNLVASKDNANDPHLQAAYQSYRDAGQVLHTRIERQSTTAAGAFAYSESNVPACQPNYPNGGDTLQPDQWVTGSLETNITCLSAINHLHLDGAYKDTMSFIGTTVLLTILFCLVFCLLLLFVTARVIIITHRIINPGLLLALLAGIVLSLASTAVFISLQGNHGAYGEMVNSDYKSVYDADLLKRVGTNANADESRWLIALKFNNTDDAQHWADDWQSNTNEVKTLIAQAQANQAWPEEIQPLADIQTNWTNYFNIDGQIRAAANNGNLQTAETLSTGQSNQAFENFTGAVDQLKKANYDHYNLALNVTGSTLNVYILLSAIIFPLIGLVAVWGVSLRFRDF